MTDFHYKLDGDIAIITWDCPDKSMNVMSETGLAELDTHIDSVLNNDDVKGAIITSGKDSFAAGMDLTVLAEWKKRGGDNPASQLMDGIMQNHTVMRKIERAGMDVKTNKGGKPIVAAMTGTGLGIGLEIPLACHRIFVADNPRAKIGLPEIMVGIFPGGGGTTRRRRRQP